MKRPLIAAFAVLCLGFAPLQAEEPPAWARDAVQKLQQEGLLQGYGNGQLSGHRAITRYELSELLNRVEARDAGQDANFATQAELSELQKSAQAVRESLDRLGSDDLEGRVHRLELRLNELGRPEL